MKTENQKKLIRVLKKTILENAKLKNDKNLNLSKELERKELEGKGYIKGRINAARYAGVSPSTIDRWRGSGLKYIKKSFKSDLFFEIKELDNFLKKSLYD